MTKTQVVEGRHILIATGARSRELPAYETGWEKNNRIPGSDEPAGATQKHNRSRKWRHRC